MPFLSPMFSDHMVLQRGKPNVFWGWTTPGASVRVTLAELEATVTAAADGRWEARLQPPPAGGPYAVTITGPQTVELQDVMVGDVWLCSGQSNMNVGLGRVDGGAEAVAAADHPNLRLFIVQQKVAYAPAAVPRASGWKVCTPETVGGAGGFSAVAYFFARTLQAHVDVPVGLIQAAVGGSPAESWISEAALQTVGQFDAPLAAIARLREQGGPQHGSFLMHWLDEYDTGLRDDTWAAPAFDDSSWTSVPLPGNASALGLEAAGVAWFRREVTLPDPLPAGPARIILGVVDKMDTTWINGRWVGASSWVENPRSYGVPAGVLQPGRNVVAVRVFQRAANGGFKSPAETLRLTLGDGSTIPLAGEWKRAISVDARPPHPMPLGFENYATMPVVLQQGMIRPVAPLAIRGAIWYQGEANFERAHQYRTLLPALIRDWRALFAQGDFPFYIVSLPAFMARRDTPGDDAWAELREAQALTVRNVPHTALAVTVDTGDADDIHPTNKQPVGERLAWCALALEYQKDVPYAGPTFSSAEKTAGGMRLHFEPTDGGLVVRGDRLAEFAIAGADRVWHWADAKIEGDTILVSSPQVPEPVAVRYAWQANPAATLFNGAGLPAAPFRTDDWPAITASHAPW